MHRRTYLVSIPDSRRKLCDHRNVICACSLLCTTSHVMPMLLDVSVYRVMFMHATSPPTGRYPLLTTALRCSDEARMHWNQLYVFHFGCQTYTVSLTRCIHAYMFSCAPAQLLVLYSAHPLTVFVSLFCVAMPAVGFRVLPSRMDAVS